MLEVYIKTRASKDTIVGQYGERLKVAIAAPAIAGKANKHLIEFLSKCFGVTQAQVKITKGDNRKCKSILIIAPTKHLTEFASCKGA